MQHLPRSNINFAFQTVCFSEWCVQEVVRICMGRRHQTMLENTLFSGIIFPLWKGLPLSEAEVRNLKNTVWKTFQTVGTLSTMVHEIIWREYCIIGGAESMVMKFHGNVRGKVRVIFLALFVSKPHIFVCVVLSHCSEFFVRMFVWKLPFQICFGPWCSCNLAENNLGGNFGPEKNINPPPLFY